MTVKELIRLLQDMPQDCDVWSEDCDGHVNEVLNAKIIRFLGSDCVVLTDEPNAPCHYCRTGEGSSCNCPP